MKSRLAGDTEKIGQEKTKAVLIILNMKRIIFLILTIVATSFHYGKSNQTHFAAKRKLSIKAEPNHKKIKRDTSKTVNLGFADKYEKLPKLTVKAITEMEFISVTQKSYIKNLKVEENKHFFFIQTAHEKHKFIKYKDYGGSKGWNGFQYLGYYPELNMFALAENSTNESLGFGQFFLLNKLNNYSYNIISFGDGRVELPIPSVNNKYLVYFYNSAYQHKNCDIGVLKINDSGNPKSYLSEHASYSSSEFAAEDIVWKSDHIFFLKGYQEVYKNEKWVKNYKYYMTEFN